MMASSSKTEAPRLLMLENTQSPGEIIVRGETCTLGRAADCDVIISGPLISRLHATITRIGPRYWISDSNSRNGTYVNAVRLAGPHMLSDGDLIGLGQAMGRFRFCDPDATAASPPAAPESAAAARLVYDPQTLVFSIDGKRLDLTRAQLLLLGHLYRHAGQVCDRESCAEAIWGRAYEPGMDAGALDQAFNALRRALSRGDPTGRWISTRRGLGYVLSLTGKTDAESS